MEIHPILYSTNRRCQKYEVTLDSILLRPVAALPEKRANTSGTTTHSRRQLRRRAHSATNEDIDFTRPGIGFATFYAAPIVTAARLDGRNDLIRSLTDSFIAFSE
ncbi:hypothetical protein [Streptomyces sp. SID12501]|uniref:Uncharacterized protein n=1 Tax=Streptomyces sp. SID12501 TaxID=2706042 RepID=A0A6B3C2H6_9ACTN|nr:hypothetical protein [Streptomyces sp. SID12501]NEC90925.1 hypothetical protein [Streptomyces sp. SID12501]